MKISRTEAQISLGAAWREAFGIFPTTNTENGGALVYILLDALAFFEPFGSLPRTRDTHVYARAAIGLCSCLELDENYEPAAK